MKAIKLQLSFYDSYACDQELDDEMGILVSFLTSEVRCGKSSWEDWILDDRQGDGTSGNIIYLEKENDEIYLGDLLNLSEKNTELKISRRQLVQLIYDWKDKVCKTMPKEVTIIRNGNDFTIETKD